MVVLSIAASNVTLATPAGNPARGRGHVVVYVDATPPPPGSPVTPGTSVISSASSRIRIAGLLVGRHTLSAVVADGANNVLNAPAQRLTVTVDGPSVVAQVVGQTVAGKSFSLSLSSYGVTISDIPTDASGRTAHYNVLIDRGVPQPGVIPRQGSGLIDTTASLLPIPPLSMGTHDIWAVLVNGAGRTLSPLSAAEVVVSVT